MLRTTSRRRFAGLAALVAIPMLVVGLVACSANPLTPSDPTQTPAADIQTGAEWSLAYAQCMRDNGVDMADPTGTDGGGMAVSSGDEQAAQTCMDKLGQPPTQTADEQKAAEDQYLDWARGVAQCYRDNGYDVIDPVAGESLKTPSDVPDSVRETCTGDAGNSMSSGG